MMLRCRGFVGSLWGVQMLWQGGHPQIPLQMRMQMQMQMQRQMQMHMLWQGEREQMPLPKVYYNLVLCFTEYMTLKYPFQFLLPANVN
jgi:hypothetical protein